MNTLPEDFGILSTFRDQWREIGWEAWAGPVDHLPGMEMPGFEAALFSPEDHAAAIDAANERDVKSWNNGWSLTKGPRPGRPLRAPHEKLLFYERNLVYHLTPLLACSAAVVRASEIYPELLPAESTAELRMLLANAPALSELIFDVDFNR